MISSTSNSQVKQIIGLLKKAKARKERQAFIIEGLRLFLEAPREQILKVYASESFERENNQILAGHSCEIISDDVFLAMSDTKTPQGILAVVKQRQYTLEEILNIPGPSQLLVLDAIQDPGNLGTMIRAGEGAGVTGVILSCDTVDIYNPKVIRSTMGSVFRVPFLYSENLASDLEKVKKKNIRLFAAHLKGKNNYEEEDYTGNIGFLIGNEANGLRDEVSELADSYVKIPMLGRVESLNAAVASSVLMFEAARQRRQGL